MTLREELLAENDADVYEAAAIMAHRLNSDKWAPLFDGYSREKAILLALKVFPEVDADTVRTLNRWGTTDA